MLTEASIHIRSVIRCLPPFDTEPIKRVPRPIQVQILIKMGLEFLVLVVINTGDARPSLDNKKTPGLPGAML